MFGHSYLRSARGLVDAGIDRIRLRLDLLPYPYQPLPWLGIQSHVRADSSKSRWDAMLPLIKECQANTAIDVGCNMGWFSLHLAEQGITTLAVEAYPRAYRTAIYSKQRLRLNNLGVLVMQVDGVTTQLLPKADCVLFLAVWHHIVHNEGLSAGTEVLQQLWERTNSVLFFETGELEVSGHYNLPSFDPSPELWISNYLSRHCEGSVVRSLGKHASSDRDPDLSRNLFSVIRTDPGATS